MKTTRAKKLSRGSLIRAVVGVLFAAAPAFAGYSSTGLVDIPGSEYLDHLQYEGDFIVAVSGDPDVPNYGVFNANVGFGGLSEVGLAVYSFWEMAALAGHFKVEVIDEEHYGRYQPAVSVGMDNLTVGDGIISHAGKRFPGDTAAYGMDFRDNVSPFVVASKTLEPLGTFHLGWGAGRFIGKGPYSEYFQGVFMGYNRRIWKTFEVMVEEDGRDINVGVRYTFPWITVGAAVEKAEQFGRAFEPFYSLTTELSPRPLHTGPERLEVRRHINSLGRRLSALRARVEGEREKVSVLRQELRELVEEYERLGVTAEELEDVYDEIDRLEKALEAAEERSAP
jgi:hypothetical protein